MARIEQKKLYGKIKLDGEILCKTGLHIGASKDNLDIGGIDAPVLRDPLTRRPYIPGSSLKGKLRSLLERKEGMRYNRHSGMGIYRHECAEPGCCVCRLFGATKEGRDGDNLPARIIVRDCPLTRESVERLQKIDTGLQYTEWKFENALDRVTAAANPRQLERVPAGARFDFEIVYNVESGDAQDISVDLTNLLETMGLLEDDFLGGHGSRGYGRIEFSLKKFASLKTAYYGAIDPKEKEAHARIFQVGGISDCKEKIDEALSLFERGTP
ncbi:MAG: type III-A CRISPR-associated RAMP protein Csm3 [Chloroflexi bacterium]|nr:type III-A CRISPR-associated RAMP protein Csm3 [Chloroflexota bacterium]